MLEDDDRACHCGTLLVLGGPARVRWCEHCDVPHPSDPCALCDRIARRCDVCGRQCETPGQARGCHRRHRAGAL